MENLSLASVGAGNMAQALLGPLAKKVNKFFVYSPTGRSAKVFSDTFGGIQKISLDSEILDCDFLFLAFKPQQYVDAVEDIKTSLKWGERDNYPTIVSMLAGTPLGVLKDSFPGTEVIRIMPNTPALVGKGVTLICPEKGIPADSHTIKSLSELFGRSGLVHLCKDEEELDQITAVTGSGPAYVFEFARIMQEYLTNKGIGVEDSRSLAVALLEGSAQLMASSQEPLAELRNKVTSKKGVTEAALNSMATDDLTNLVHKALDKNVERSKELRQDALNR